MPLAGSLIVNIRKIFGDTAAQFIDDISGLTWLDQAQQDFCNDVWMLEEIKDYAITQYDNHFILPSNCIIPMSAMWYQTKTIKLEPEPPNVWDQLTEAYPLSTGNPYHYTMMRRAQDTQEIRIGPAKPSRSSYSASVAGNIATTATTLALTAASGIFRSRGWVLIGGPVAPYPGSANSGFPIEVAEYNGVSGSSLTGVIRAQHDTYASNLVAGVLVTQVDLQVRYKKLPSILATNTTPEIPEPFHRYLETYALYLAKLAHGEPKEADGYLQVYLKQKETARKMAGRRQQDGLMRIKARRLGSLYPPV